MSDCGKSTHGFLSATNSVCLLTHTVASKPCVFKPERFKGHFENALTIFKATKM